MIKIGSIFTIDIISNTNLGDGVGKIEDKPVYIPNAIQGDKLEVTITKKNKKYLKGEITKIITPSLHRIKSLCPYFPKCGGCTFFNIDILKENIIKENYIKKIFKGIKVNDIISNNELNYRNKATFHVHNGKLGYYQKNTKTLIEVDNCYILNKKINILKDVLNKLDLTNVTEIMVRYSQEFDELLIKITGKIKNYDALKHLKNVKSIYINDILVHGKPNIKEKIGNFIFLIGPNSFFQINTDMIKVLYDTIKKHITPQNSLLDLYCGIGTIGIYLSSYFNNITGVDIISENIAHACLNQKLNQITNITFQNKDAKDITDTYFDTIIVDPPRSGLGFETTTHLLNINPENIIYVSCNPNTLKKDTEILKEKYKITEITPINMFPKTEHIECVILLQRKD